MNQAKRGAKKKRTWWWDTWSRVLLDYYNMESTLLLPERLYNLYSNDRAIMSNKSRVSVFFSIDDYPSMAPIDLRDRLREVVLPGVRISFISNSYPTNIEWESPEMKNRMAIYKRMSEEVEGKGGDVYKYRENKGSIDKDEWLKYSIRYYVDATTERKAELFDYRSCFVISGERGEDLDRSIEAVTATLAKMGILATRITRDLGDFLRCFSPFSLEANDKVSRSVGKKVLPDEVVSRFVNYRQGKIGSIGVYTGTDVTSGYAIVKQFKKEDIDAENLVILAETGGGKSYLVKTINIQLLAHPNIRGTIMDIEGFEYLPLAHFFANHDDVCVLNMAEGQGSYFDPVSIHLSGDPDFDRDVDVFGTSRSYTMALFKTLVGADVLDDRPWAKTIIEDAVSCTYAGVGVVQSDVSTWGRASDLTIHDVYQEIVNMHMSVRNPDRLPADSLLRGRLSNEEFIATLDLVRARIGRYFESLENGGSLNTVFSNRVSLEEVANAKLVVCSFGMASRSKISVDEVQMALAQLSAANISHLRSIQCKREGKYNVKVWEELQRWASFPGSDEILRVAATGGRKMGDINILVSNEPGMFLGTGKSLDIFSNITSFMIGSIRDHSTRHALAKELAVPELASELDRLALEAGGIESFNANAEVSGSLSESKYKRAFLQGLDQSVVTIGKLYLPDYISHSQLLRTGASTDNVLAPKKTSDSDKSVEDLLALDLSQFSSEQPTLGVDL